jgi:hypothetical protein
MDRTCPECHANLMFKRLKTFQIEYPRHSGYKLILAHCLKCHSPLEPNDHPSEFWAGVVFLLFLSAPVFTVFYADKNLLPVISLSIIAAYSVGLTWFYRVYMKDHRRWKAFIRNEDDWMKRDSERLNILSRRPKRNINFRFQQYLKDLALSVVLILPLAVLGFNLDFGVSGFILSFALSFMFICFWQLIVSHFDMGMWWSFALLMYFFMLSLLLSIATHPWFFDTPLSPTPY